MPHRGVESGVEAAYQALRCPQPPRLGEHLGELVGGDRLQADEHRGIPVVVRDRQVDRRARCDERELSSFDAK